MLLDDLFGRTISFGDNINDVGTSLHMVFNEFIDPLRQIDDIPLSVIVKTVRWKHPHIRMRRTQASELL